MESTLPRVIFMGTPDFAVPAMRVLAESSACDLVLVVTQPDRPSGRGRKLAAPPVKIVADELDVPVVQTHTLRDTAVRERITAIQPDLVVVAAFGMILGKWILELPTHGCVNLHASLLPAYRGANPIAAAVAGGETVTGVTLMQMDRGLDTGPMLAAIEEPIQPDDTTDVLTQRLGTAAATLLSTRLDTLLAGELEAIPQPAGATLTRPMRKVDGWIDWTRPAADLERHVRAMWPWPRAWTDAGDITLQVHAASVVDATGGAPGEIVHEGKRVVVGTGDGGLNLTRVQVPGGKPVEGTAIAHLGALKVGTVIGTDDGPGDHQPLTFTVDP